MTREDIDTLWNQALQESVKAGEQFTRYHFAALVADAEAKRMHDEGMVTVGHMREQIAAEREACAKVCDDFERAKWESVKNITENGGRLAFAGPMHCAAAIRARGQA